MMNLEQKSIESICPNAWKTFIEWCELAENEQVKIIMFNQKDFRIQIGAYVDFFIRTLESSSSEMKKIMLSHSLTDPIDEQKNTIYSLFVKLECMLCHD